MSEDDLLSREQAGFYLQKKGCAASPSTLAKMAVNDNEGRGPPFIRYRTRIVRYRRGDLDAWAAKELKIVK